MIGNPFQQDLESLLLENLKGGNVMKGSVYHLRGICRLCQGGDKNTLRHPNHYIQLYLGYLEKKNHKLYGREKRRTFEDGIDAWIYLKEIQRQIEDQTFIPWNYRESEGSITLFENFFDRFKGKYSAYRKYFTSLLTKDLKTIDRIEIKKFYRNLPKDLKQSSKNLILKILRATLSEAYEEGLIDFIPAFPKRKKSPKSVKNCLTPPEQILVINAMPENYRLFFLFLAGHGKRLKESLSLRWENIDFKKKACRLYQSKILSEQWLPLHESFFSALPVVGIIHKTGNIFEYHTNTTYNNILKRACLNVGVVPVTTHEFGRHSFISQRQDLGVSDRKIAMVTENLGSIDEYSHMSLEKKRKVINLVEL